MAVHAQCLVVVLLCLSAVSAQRSHCHSDREVIFHRRNIPGLWDDLGKAPARAPTSFWLALAQRNLDVLAESALAVSDPRSPSWGQHRTIQQIRDLVDPLPADVLRVEAWVQGAAGGNARIVSHGDALEVHTTVDVAEILFCTQMRRFKHSSGLRVTKAVGEVSVPAMLRPHIDLVTTLSDFPSTRRGPKFVRTTAMPDVVQNNNYVTPAQTILVSGLPNTPVASPKATQGVVEFGIVIPHETGQDGGGGGGFQFSDLQAFAQETSTSFINVSSIVGPFQQLKLGGTAESLLDTEYITHVAPGSPTTYSTYLVWMYEFAAKLFADPSAPLVNSLSYATAEYLMCNKTLNGAPNNGCETLGVDPGMYIDRANTELAKLALRGITILSASGDNGAPSEINKQCERDGDEYSMFPLFPATSPYVLAVGGVALHSEYTGSHGTQTAMCKKSGGYCGSTPYSLETSSVINGGITSGGGFSNYTARPSYQDAAVMGFLESSAFRPPANKFKSQNRAYPDVAHLATNILILQNGQILNGAGTSASTPMVAAIISRLNGHMISKGLPPLGWVNPLVYQMGADDPSTFFDVTVGNNTCTEMRCCKYGYGATTGWDPATGFGVPNYPKILAYVEGLVAKK